MSYLADSDWVASYLNGRRNAIDLLDALKPQCLAISVGEIYEGIYVVCCQCDGAAAPLLYHL